MQSKHTAVVLSGGKIKSMGYNKSCRNLSCHAEQNAIMNYLRNIGRKDLQNLFDFNNLITDKRLVKSKRHIKGITKY
jgi:deoxycytidylate deaminase